MSAFADTVSSWAGDNAWLLLATTLVVIVGEVFSEVLRHRSNRALVGVVKESMELLQAARGDMAETAKVAVDTLSQIALRASR